MYLTIFARHIADAPAQVAPQANLGHHFSPRRTWPTHSLLHWLALGFVGREQAAMAPMVHDPAYMQVRTRI